MYSSIRKRALSGWLKKYHEKEFLSPLKLQKFLFFYETLSKVEKDNVEFKKLKGYPNGPVFSDVYGDYVYEKNDFFKEVNKVYKENTKLVDKARAKFAGFLVSIMNEEELSALTHEFNIWKVKENDINNGLKDVSLCEKDFNIKDTEFLMTLRDTYSNGYIDSVEVFEISEKSFILNKQDIPKLNNKSRYTFISLANEKNLQNPVYVSVSNNGVLLVD